MAYTNHSKKDINQIINEWVIHAQKSQVREPYHIAKYLHIEVNLLTLLHSERGIR